MRTLFAFLAVLMFSVVVGCATTEYKPYEAKNNVFEGKGGTKVIVDGMELWDNGDPPRKFKVLGIIDDQRPGGVIPMSQLRSDIVKKAREAVVMRLSNSATNRRSLVSTRAVLHPHTRMAVRPRPMGRQRRCRFVGISRSSRSSSIWINSSPPATPDTWQACLPRAGATGRCGG